MAAKTKSATATKASPKTATKTTTPKIAKSATQVEPMAPLPVNLEVVEDPKTLEVVKVESPEGEVRKVVRTLPATHVCSLPLPPALQAVKAITSEDMSQYFGSGDVELGWPVYAIDPTKLDFTSGTVNISDLFASSLKATVSNGVVNLLSAKSDFSVDELLETFLASLEAEAHTICYLHTEGDSQYLGIAGDKVFLAEGVSYTPVVFFKYKEGGRGIKVTFQSYFDEGFFGQSPAQAEQSTNTGIRPSSVKTITESDADELWQIISEVATATNVFFNRLLDTKFTVENIIEVLSLASSGESAVDEDGNRMYAYADITPKFRTLNALTSYCELSSEQDASYGTALSAWSAWHYFHSLVNRGIVTNDSVLLAVKHLRLPAEEVTALLARQWSGRYGQYIGGENTVNSVKLNEAIGQVAP